jgi:hypothetical protein
VDVSRREPRCRWFFPRQDPNRQWNGCEPSDEREGPAGSIALIAIEPARNQQPNADPECDSRAGNQEDFRECERAFHHAAPPASSLDAAALLLEQRLPSSSLIVGNR